MDTEDQIETLLEKGVNDGVFPGAVLLVARAGEIVFFRAFGHRSLTPAGGPMGKDTIFDLASLTKPLATTIAMMKLVDAGEISLDEPLSRLLPGDLPEGKGTLTPRLLLSHSAGLVDWRPFFLKLSLFDPRERKHLARKWIMDLPLAYAPGKNTQYSDLGFMLLEWIIEEISGMSLPLFLDQHFYAPLSLARTFFSSNAHPIRFEDDQYAPTELCPWRKILLLGRVHDENAYAMGGYSGHAGLFGTAEEVYRIVRVLIEHFSGIRDDCFRPETVKTFFIRQDYLVDGSTRALGWDTPSAQNSSSGKYFSAKSIGHLGFTGTSVWTDLDKDVAIVLLTNRVHPTRDNVMIRAFRPGLHNIVMEQFVLNLQ